MYVSISVRKLIDSIEEGQKLIDTVKTKLADQEKVEIGAQIVKTIKLSMTSPCDPIR